MVNKRGFLISEVKQLELSGWGSEYGAIEKICYDSKTPTDHSSSGILIIGGKSGIPLHYHNCETFHYVLYGSGTVEDADGNEYELKPQVTFYCGPGPEGAHSFKNNDDFPLAILWVHTYPKGIREKTVWIEKEE